jgi:hypothetical protein
MAASDSKQLRDPSNMMGAARQSQLQNAQILQSLMDQKLQLSLYEDQIRSRMMLPPSDPILQANLMNDPRFLMAASMGGNFRSLNTGVPTLLPSPHELSFRVDGKSLRGGVIEPFPEKLHRLLREVEAAGMQDVISFIANGKAFQIHKPDKFFKEIVPRYFRQSRLSSFKRQLNLYGFELINTGPARGGYYHKSFVKDQPELCRKMRRVAVKVHASDKKPPGFSSKGKTPPPDEEKTTAKDEKGADS